jgi:acyl dehydratase
MTKTTTPTALQAMIGHEIALSNWVEISQERIDTFAKATEDFQFIHVDPEAASKTPFGGTIAHGFLTLSIIPLLSERSDVPRCEGVRMVLNYGVDKVRFITPVPSAKRIRGRFKLLDLIEKRPGQWQQTMGVTVEIEGLDKPAMVAEWITQMIV